MAAIRCAGAGRALLRRSPGLFRRAAGGERGVLGQPIRALLAPSSNRYYISSYFDSICEPDKKKLAVELMKERSAGTEIENLDELLGLIKSSKLSSDQHTMQAAMARKAIEDKKHELVSLLLRGDGGQEYKKTMEELAVAARRHRESLVLEDLKGRCKTLEEVQAKIIAGIALWGLPLTLVVFAQWH